MPKPFPREFREDVVRVARSREEGVSTPTGWPERTRLVKGGGSRPSPPRFRYCPEGSRQRMHGQ